MTGSVSATFSPVRAVTPSYSVDSFSEYSTRSVTRGVLTPSAAILKAGGGPPSTRERHEDEELFRDLFAAEIDGVSSKTRNAAQHTATTFMPIKPVVRPASEARNKPQPCLASMRPEQSRQPTLSAPVPRLNLEELLSRRPNYDNDAEGSTDSYIQTAQVDDEDEYNGDMEEVGPETTFRTPQQSTSDFNSSLGFGSVEARLSDNNKLEQETLCFLEKLDLKAVLHTPRPDLLNFYPNAAVSPSHTAIATAIGGVLQRSRGNNCEHVEDGQDARPGVLEKEWLSPAKDKPRTGSTMPRKETNSGSMSSRLAYMEVMYGTTPNAPRKARRQTIDRLAHPFSGHASTLQALSPEQRQRRESALTGGALTSPIAVALNGEGCSPRAVKNGRVSLSDRLSLTPRSTHNLVAKTPVAAQQRPGKRRDPLVQRRRPAPPISNQAIRQKRDSQRHHGTQKTTAARPVQRLDLRKEALKKRLQGRSDGCQRQLERCSQPIGGGTFLTQDADEDGVGSSFNLSDRRHAVARSALTSRTSKSLLPQRPTFSQAQREPKIDKSRPCPPQKRRNTAFSRTLAVSKRDFKAPDTKTSRRPELPRNILERRSSRPRRGSGSNTSSTRFGQAAIQASHQPKRPPPVKQPATGTTRRSTGVGSSARRVEAKLSATPYAASSTMRRTKVQRPTAPKTTPSVSTSLLMGLTPFVPISAATTESRSGRITRRSLGQSPRGASRMSISYDNGRTAVSSSSKANVSTQRRRRTTTVEPTMTSLNQPRAPRPSLPAITLPLQPDHKAPPRRGFSGRRIRARVVTNH